MENIEIKLLDSSEPFMSGWLVKKGDKYAYGLSYDEMLGLVAALTMPAERPCLQWMKTEKMHIEYQKRLENIKNNVSDHA